MLNDQRPDLGLNEFIDQVKSELFKAQKESDALFILSEVELEIEFEVAKHANGGVKFVVLQAGVDKTLTSVQTLRVKLEPLLTPEQIRNQLTDDEKTTATEVLKRTYQRRG
jgi:hypothetical protein